MDIHVNNKTITSLNVVYVIHRVRQLIGQQYCFIGWVEDGRNGINLHEIANDVGMISVWQ